MSKEKYRAKFEIFDEANKDDIAIDSLWFVETVVFVSLLAAYVDLVRYTPRKKKITRRIPLPVFTACFEVMPL